MSWPLMGETITMSDRLKMAYFTLTAKKFTNGEKVKQFEEEWNKWLGSRHSLYVSSGSTANFLLVASVKELYGLKAGDKVLVPACTWVTNVAPIIQLGLEPVFVDINLNNFSFNIEQLKKIRNKKDIKMIFVTHLLGFAGNHNELRNMFPNALIIDDVCESHGCKYQDHKVGSKSLGATFSFYFGHHMSTIEGGMISTNSCDLYNIMKMKRGHGLARESKNFQSYANQYPNIDKQFLFMTDGYNFRNHEIPAVLGLSQLKRLDIMIERRRQNYKMFVNIINEYPSIFYPLQDNPGNSSFCLPFVCKQKTTMNELKKIFNKHNIEYRPIVSGNLLKQPFLKNYSLKHSNNVDVLHNNGVYIGNSHFVGSYELESLSELLKDYYVNTKTI
tara:strand:+ start:352 stop:1515 length:1164 start_codon:yes stop_codon:yes gene_type:complete